MGGMPTAARTAMSAGNRGAYNTTGDAKETDDDGK